MHGILLSATAGTPNIFATPGVCAVWGFAGDQTLRFGGIPQPAIRELAKRWLRWRPASGLGLEATRRGLRALTKFARFCDSVGVTGLAGIDRPVMERYLADLHAERPAASAKMIRSGSSLGSSR
jgi:hypothetical protein